VAVAGHRPIQGVTNIELDHRFAAELALGHLYSLGHRRIAFIRGQPFSSDSDDRWRNIVQVAKEIGIPLTPELIVELDQDASTPELGYVVMQRLLATGERFTALACFNDLAAIGAMRAFEDFGLHVPEDISVIGFDDIKVAAFAKPRLTTIRQPMSNIGRIAAQSVLNRLKGSEPFRERITVEPELVVRESTKALPFASRPKSSK